MSFKKNEINTAHFCMKNPLAVLQPSITPTCEVKLGSGNFAACTNSAVEDTTNSGWFSIVLTAAEMNADVVTFRASAADILDYDLTIYPEPKMVDDLKDETMRGTDNIGTTLAGYFAEGGTIESLVDSIPADILAMTGITAGGTTTFAEAIKYLMAERLGTWRLKAGETNIYELLDFDDGSVVAELITADSETVKQVIKV